MDIRVSELVPAAAQRPPDSEPFFRKSQREYVGVSAREGREGGRKGINISESRSLRRKLEEPDDNVTFVRWFPPPFPSYLKKASPAGERPRAPAVGEDRTKKAVKTNALPAALSTRSPSGDLKWTIPPPLFLPPSTEPNFYVVAAAAAATI